MVCQHCRSVKTVDVGVGDDKIVQTEERGVGDGIIEPDYLLNEVPNNNKEKSILKMTQSQSTVVKNKPGRPRKVFQNEQKLPFKLKIKLNSTEPSNSSSVSVKSRASKSKSTLKKRTLKEITAKLNAKGEILKAKIGTFKSKTGILKAKTGILTAKTGNLKTKTKTTKKISTTKAKLGCITEEAKCLRAKTCTFKAKTGTLTEKSSNLNAETNVNVAGDFVWNSDDEFAVPVIKKKKVYKKTGCKICGRLFRTTYLKQHMQSHEEDQDKKRPHVCEKCDRQFVSLYYLNDHRKVCVQDPSAYQCHICGKNMLTKNSLDYHVKAHTSERSFQCHMCAKLFKSRATLTSHIRSHSEAKPYACDLCDKRFKVKKSLECHKSKFHEGIVENFPCELCDKVFHRKERLQVHLDQHGGIKRHRCSECGKRFSCPSVLRTHSLIHKDKKKFSCSECGKGFNQGTDLKRHMSTHTGIKPFKCDECGRQFIHRVYLVRHKCSKKPTGNNMENNQFRIPVNNEPLDNHMDMEYANLTLNGSDMLNPLIFQSQGT